MNPPLPSEGIPLFIVDAFASGGGAGNPAAVCLLDQPATEAWMARVAGEMNLSETAFVVRPGADGVWGLRWFTPSVEVDLCGHATLAAAHALWDSGRAAASDPVAFATRRSGMLGCRPAGDGWIAMDFPARPVEPGPLPPGLAGALGCEVLGGGRSAYDYLVEVRDAATVRGLQPDLAALARLPVRGVIVTAAGEREGGAYDFVSRFFAPAAGVPEDPVTGSAHCSLAPFWAARLGRNRLRAWQASARGGEVRVELKGAGPDARVELGGRARTQVAGRWVGGA